MDERHDSVDSSAHVVCFEAANELVEFGARGADSKEERDLNEEDDEEGDPDGKKGVSEGRGERGAWEEGM